ncbi:uncharacterized protein DFL_002271 [Arthrobotrys flagrans]|uniref:Uncharacterized protein n=1 Tax=Arthrobotrys flagrans TaxID=97331 RepID=A0A437A9Z7_ARTFL|nr:hypothetical protein DFL_002271 [Arthrobotrys flagrans]
MVPNWFSGTNGVRKTDRDASACQLIWLLLQRQTHPTCAHITADEYQAALDKIPYNVGVDARNSGYRWENAPLNAQGRRA